MLTAALFCLVVGVVDGDTVDVRCADATMRVRLSEVDAPERSQAWGNRSREALARLCFGEVARVEATGAAHRGRIIAKIQCRGTDAGIELVRAGLAWQYVRYSTDPQVTAAEKLARSNKAGLWIDVDTKSPPVAPWLWRQGSAAASR